MKKRILLVDDEVTVLLTMKAILEISGFDVDTAASARDGKLKLRKNQYDMIITDMRMESEAAGAEVIEAARKASYHPAIALLTAFPVEEEAWQEMGADKMLVKPMHTGILLKQIDQLFVSHEAKLAKLASRIQAEAAALENGSASRANAPAPKPAKLAPAKNPAKTAARPGAKTAAQTAAKPLAKNPAKTSAKPAARTGAKKLAPAPRARVTA